MSLGGADGELKNCLQTCSSSPPAGHRLKPPHCVSMWLLWPEVEPLGSHTGIRATAGASVLRPPPQSGEPGTERHHTVVRPRPRSHGALCWPEQTQRPPMSHCFTPVLADQKFRLNLFCVDSDQKVLDPPQNLGAPEPPQNHPARRTVHRLLTLHRRRD